MFAGLAVSTAGDWLYSIALVVYVYDSTGSPGWVALASVLRLLPYIVVGPFAGAVVDRYDRRLVMLYSNLLRSVYDAGDRRGSGRRWPARTHPVCWFWWPHR